MDDDVRRDELGGDLPVEGEGPLTGYGVPAPRSKRSWTIPLLAAGLVVALATAVVFGTLYLTSDVTGEEVGEHLATGVPAVEEVASRVANLLMNYDSTNLDEVSDQMLTIATGNFRDQYEDVLASGAGLGPALEESSASSRGQITSGPDVYFESGSEAVALLETRQTAQSNSNPAGSTYVYVLKITLIETSDDGWKADRVEVLSTQQV